MDAREALIFLSILEKRARSVNAIQKPDLSEILKKALKKQIPKEPTDQIEIVPVQNEKGKWLFTEDFIDYYCPVCREWVGNENSIYKFCPECGQAINGRGA